MTLEQPKPTKEQIVTSDLGMQIARLSVENAHLRADNQLLEADNQELQGQIADASDRA